jgi:acyl-CoA synthetase (AMP-forming)/AMP-acid ligase II
MNVKYLIIRAMREYPNNLALVTPEVRRTFRELNLRSNSLANGLINEGLRVGDKVGILLSNCAEFIETDFALSKIGMVRVPLNARLNAEDHEYMLKDSEANGLIYGSRFAEVVKRMRPKLGKVTKYIQVKQHPYDSQVTDNLDFENLILSNESVEPNVKIDEEDLHTIFYTSGTTGKPKGAMLTHKSWASVAINLLLDYGPVTQEDKILNLQPLSHGAGFFVLPFFVRGATNLLIRKFNPEAVFSTIEKEGVTVLKLVPTMLYQLLESPIRTNYNLDSLHTIIYGGSPIAVTRLIEAVEFFGQKLVQLYGQAEAPMCITTLSKRDHIIEGMGEGFARLHSAGKPLTNVEVKVVNESGQELSSGEIGEVIVRGQHIMTGYWNKPEETAEVLKNGWVYTGDLGYTDAGGYVFLVDRKKDMIISGGFNIYPSEIEDILRLHPNVKDVAVIGVPDEKWGEAVKAVVVPKSQKEFSEEEIIAFCRDHLPSFKKPKSVDTIDVLPRNPYGKIQKSSLREPYWRGRQRRIN